MIASFFNGHGRLDEVDFLHLIQSITKLVNASVPVADLLFI